MRIAVIHNQGGQLKVSKVFDWSRAFPLVGPGHPDYRKGSHRFIKADPDRLVDVDERPDIKEGDTYPFGPKPTDEGE